MVWNCRPVILLEYVKRTIMKYPVKFIEDGEGWIAIFPDLPEAIASANTKEETLKRAKIALIASLGFYFDNNRTVPMPSKASPKESCVTLPPSLWAKVLLLNEMLVQQIKPVELARRLNKTPQAVNRIRELHHPTKIDTLASAYSALGKELVLTLADKN